MEDLQRDKGAEHKNIGAKVVPANEKYIPAGFVARVAEVTIFILTMFYYGWFYSVKGASLGKILLKLRVIDDTTGQNLSMTRAILRESLGKICSTLPLFVGFVMAGFRDDHKALHDIMFNTQVMQRVRQ